MASLEARGGNAALDSRFAPGGRTTERQVPTSITSLRLGLTRHLAPPYPNALAAWVRR